MANWVHLSFTFKDIQKTRASLHTDASQDKPSGIYKELVNYLEKIVGSLSLDLIGRFFYLFEDTPHLFLAIELRDINKANLIKEKADSIKMPDFVDSIKLDLNTSDEGNGEEALDLFWAGTKYAFFRCNDTYKPGYYNNDEVKMFHCISNQLFVSWENEIIFYLRCLLHRGVKEVNAQMVNGRNIQAKLDDKEATA